MNHNIVKYANRFGIDKAIIYTSASRIVQALGSVASLFFVAKYLTGIEQGFYYTFGSIVAIQVFFELGLNGIITQYVAHEASYLKWQNNIQLIGETKYISRLSSLLKFSIKWYLSFALVLLLTLIIVGLLFFNKYHTTSDIVYWKQPWLLLSVGTSLNLLVAPLIAFLEGLGKVKEMAKIRLIQYTFGLVITWSGLIFGAKLLVPGIVSLVGVFILIVLLILGNYFEIIKNLWQIPVVEKVHYRNEILPYQWKIALSWISGYFIFQLFNPVLFATEGAVVAGQMGMTLAALNGILSLSMAWITTKIPLFSGLIAQNDFVKLDIIFNKALKQSVLINFSALSFLFLIIFLIRFFEIEAGGKLLGNRFLDYMPLFLMMIPILLNQFSSSWATYLRCHKKEPFLVISLVGGVLCLLSIIIFGKLYGVIGVTSGYCFIVVITFPWSYAVFRNRRIEWHQIQ